MLIFSGEFSRVEGKVFGFGFTSFAVMGAWLFLAESRGSRLAPGEALFSWARRSASACWRFSPGSATRGLGDEDLASFLGQNEWGVGFWRLGWLRFRRLGPGRTSGIKEALEFGGQAGGRREFVGHPDVGGAVAGVLDAGAEIARRADFTGRGADDTREEIVDFEEAQSDGGGAGLLDGFDAGEDGFPAEQAVSAGGGDTTVFRTVDIDVGLGGISARGDFAGESFVACVG